jgi:hypothetical protein
MATKKQLHANRRNAFKSTGPRTPRGKALAAGNALTHGLSARKLLLTKKDDPHEFQQFRDRVWHDLNPVGQIEIILAERILAAAWRLRRILRIETEILDRDLKKKRTWYQKKKHFDPDAQPPSLGSTVADNLNSVNTYGKLLRHETTLENSLHRNLKKLQQLQSQRLDLPAELPPYLLLSFPPDHLPS